MVPFIVVLIIVGLLAVLYVVHLATDWASSSALQAFNDSRRRSRHAGHATAGAPSGIYWSGGQRASLGMLVSTRLSPDDALAVVRSLALQLRGTNALARHALFATVDGERSGFARVTLRTEKRLLLQFPVTAVPTPDANSTLLRLGGLTKYGYTQSMFLGFIPSGPRRIHGWDTYLELLDRVSGGVRALDASSESRFVDGTRSDSVLPPRVTVGAASRAELARSNELPAGERTCRRLNCAARGVPTDTLRCPSCDHPTVLLGEYRDDLMAAPGVLYDPNYVPPPPEPVNPSMSGAAAGVVVVPEIASAMGGRTCARIRCAREGIRTDDERCAVCGFATIPLTTFRGQLR